MRITGGRARGIPIQSPAKGDIRPATDYLREAVFASLGPRVQGAKVLDCFAGTGAYALEALSRGAARATLVELNAAAVRAIRANAQAVGKSAGFVAEAVVAVQQADAVVWVRQQARSGAGRYTLIFADPPYPVWDQSPAALLEALSALLDKSDADARLVLEAPGNWPPPQLEGLALLRHLKKGARQPSALVYAPLPQGDSRDNALPQPSVS